MTKYSLTTQPTYSVPLEHNLKWVFAMETSEDLLLILNQGFIYCKKSETMPKSKFKVEKLCHDIYFKFGQYYRYYINIRCLMMSTDQADPSFFYFRIS